MEAVAELLADDVEVVITHGNGPQVGNLLVKNELAAAVVPPVPLDWCGAQTQATLGFVLMDALDAVARRGAACCAASATVVTRTLVDRGRPGVHQADQADRPVPAGRRGAAARRARRDLGGPRREGLAPGRRLAGAAGDPRRPGGAGADRGGLRGRRQRRRRHPGACATATARCAASRPSSTRTSGAALLARTVGADVLVIATDVPHAVLRYGTPEAEPTRHASTVAEMRAYAAEGQFASGSMGPKVDAVCRFVEQRRQPCGHHRASTTSPTPSPRRRRHRRRPEHCTTSNLREMAPCPTPSKYARSPSTPSPTPRAREADRRRRHARRPRDRDHRQDRGQRRGQRLHPDHRRPRVPRGAGRQGRRRPTQVKQVPIVWSGGTDGVISPHATIFATVPPEDGRTPSDEPRLTVGFAMSEQLLPEDIGRTRDDHEGRRRGEGRDGAGRHHRPGRRALRADQDPAAHHPHDPRRQVARARPCGPRRPTSRWTSPTAAPRSASRSRSARSRCRPTTT